MTMIHLAAEKACHVARSVDKTPTAAVLKEALETVSEIELLPHLGYFTVRHTTKTQERYTRRHFYTNCIFSRLPGEKHQVQKIKEWVGNKVCNRVTKQICRRVFSNGLRRRECHNVRKRICRIICKWVT